MATQSDAPSTTHCPILAGTDFVGQYYKTLVESPDKLHEFYHESSSMYGANEDGGKLLTATTMKDIKDKISSMDYKNCKIAIESLTAVKEPIHDILVRVSVRGLFISDGDNNKRTFTHTFDLCSNGEGYYVKDGFFRFLVTRKPVKDSDKKPQRASSSNVHEKSNGHSVYIRDLSPNATEADVQTIFAQFGPIKRGGIKLGRSEIWGPVYCFGFVTFQDLSSKERAIKNSPVTICGVEAGVEEKVRLGGTYDIILSEKGDGHPSLVSGRGGRDSFKALGSSTTLSINPPIVDTPGGPARAHDSPTSSGSNNVHDEGCELNKDSCTSIGGAAVHVASRQMATQSDAPSTTHCPILAGTEFVGQYYKTMVESPDKLHEFYHESSSMQWASEDGGKLLNATTMEDIIDKISSMDYNNCKIVIESLTAVKVHIPKILVRLIVRGLFIRDGDENARTFTQTFDLSSKGEGYYVKDGFFSLVAPMAELLCDDIYEKVFITLDVQTLIRCKSVCKSWKALISGSTFVKAHLKRSYNRNDNGHKRISQAVFRCTNSPCPGDDIMIEGIIGFSNGLVCISVGYDCNNMLLVGNPSTRELRIVSGPYRVSCSGFGYDSLTDDYKVVVGATKSNHKTCFEVFSLRSNAWKVTGDVNYTRFGDPTGVLCNGAIHWIMHPNKNKNKPVILSFDLSKEEFKEIPQPDDARYNFGSRVGIMEEFLCLWEEHGDPGSVWIMKKYNDIQSWEMLPDNCKIKFEDSDDFYQMRPDMYCRPGCWFIGPLKFSGGPNIVESLVSPFLAENE